MADLNDRPLEAPALRKNLEAGTDGGSAPPSRSGSLPADPKLTELVEALFFAYRDFTGEADQILARFEFGRAHHRVLHFVHRNPGLSVTELLSILNITKQSLSRVLRQLVEEGFVVQSSGPDDRRERRLTLTDRGEALARKLIAVQVARMTKALHRAGAEQRPEVVDEIRAFLTGLRTDAPSCGTGAENLSREPAKIRNR